MQLLPVPPGVLYMDNGIEVEDDDGVDCRQSDSGGGKDGVAAIEVYIHSLLVQ